MPDVPSLVLPIAVLLAGATALVVVAVDQRRDPTHGAWWFAAAIVAFMAAATPFDPFGFEYRAADNAWAWRLPVALFVALPAVMLHVVDVLVGGDRARLIRTCDALTVVVVAWLFAMPSLPGPDYPYLPWWFRTVFIVFLIQTVVAILVSVLLLLRASQGSTGAASMRGRLLAAMLATFGSSYLVWFAEPVPELDLIMSIGCFLSALLFWLAIRAPRRIFELVARERTDPYVAVEGLVASPDVRGQLADVLQVITHDWGLAGLVATDGDGRVIEVVGSCRVASSTSVAGSRIVARGSNASVTLEAWPAPLTPHLRRSDREQLTMLAHLIELALQREATADRQQVADTTTATAELQIARSQARLAQALELRDRAAREVARDLRSPVNALLGLSDEHDARWRELPADQLAPLQGLVARQVGRIAAVVDKLLVLSSIGDGTLSSVPESVDVRRLVQSFADTHVDAQVTHSRTGDVDHFSVVTEPVALREIVSQLFENAQRHGEAPIHVMIASADDHVTIEVTDHGPGVQPEFVETLFDRFTRDGAATTRGLGIGLAIARELARHLGGSMGHRRDATCTVFWLRLPRTSS